MSDCCAPPKFVAPKSFSSEGGLRTVVLIGPPNSGKSTLFNRLTGLRQKVANFPGVTVEQRLGLMAGIGREDLTLIDLPGIYSLDPFSEDARVSIDVLNGKMPGTPKPDAVLLVMDSLHLTRQLMLAAPVLALGLPTLILLNMIDLMEERGGEIDPLKLSRELGAPVAKISAVQGRGLDAVPLFLNRHTDRQPAKPLSLPVLGNAASAHAWAAQVSRKTGYRAPLSVEGTRKIDNVLLHRIWGPLFFLFVVFAVFEVVFSLGQPLSDGLGDLLDRVGALVTPLLPAGWIQSLVIDGAWKGVSSVLVFLPQILILFLFIGLLEDSGYLARAALIADRVMRTTGLNGKAFIPLLSGYACAVPAIMATRTIENKRDRFATIMVTPFMTCSARLPVYMLLIAAFVPHKLYLHGLVSLQTLTMLGLYLAGFVGAMTTAWLLKSSLLRSHDAPFILELPQYRTPTVRSIGLRLLDRAKVFVRQAGTIILSVTLVLWVLGNLPLSRSQTGGLQSPAMSNSLLGNLGHFVEPAIAPLGFDWKVGIGLLSSVAAREVMVSTMGTLYGSDPATKSLPLEDALHHDLTLPSALALMVFFVFAMQCTSTMAVVRRETNSWRWPAFQFLYMLALAWIAAFVVHYAASILLGS